MTLEKKIYNLNGTMYNLMKSVNALIETMGGKVPERKKFDMDEIVDVKEEEEEGGGEFDYTHR